MTVIDDQSWRRDAACAAAVRAGAAKTADWYPDNYRFTRPAARRAIEICDSCSVKTECLEAALADPAGSDFGIWAGTSRRQRARLRQLERSA